MQKIPYQTQIESAEQNLCLTSEFCQKVLRGLSLTQLRSLYPKDFTFALSEAGLFKNRDEDELYDSLTFGELCTEIYDLIQIPYRRKDLAERLAARPFIKTSETDCRFAMLNKSRSASQADCDVSYISPFDPEFLNNRYQLCENSSDARYFYWTRWMTEEQFFSAAFALTANDEINNIIEDFHAGGRSFEDRIQYIGEDLKNYEEVLDRYDPPYDVYERKTFQNPNRAEAEKKFFSLAEKFIIIPISKIYEITKKENF